MIGIVIGTRPELLKLRPVARELKVLGVPLKIIYTEQHRAICEEVGDLAVEIYGHRQCVWVQPLDGWQWQPKAIVVQGDTDSARKWALDAAFRQIPVIHVEAGLRTSYTHVNGSSPPIPSRNPFPEELNRQLISRVAALHLAPTYANERNLITELVGGKVVITGNPGISAVQAFVDEYVGKCTAKYGQLDWDERTIIVTCHRRENWPHIRQLIEELKFAADWSGKDLPRIKGYEVVLVKHPNESLYNGTEIEGDEHSHLLAIQAQPWDEMIRMLIMARLVVTDSGGLLEEATWLGKRRLVLRTETERPEACAALTPILGCHKAILDAIDQPAPSPGSRFAFGDAGSARRCAREIESFYKEL